MLCIKKNSNLDLLYVESLKDLDARVPSGIWVIEVLDVNVLLTKQGLDQALH